MLAKAFIWNLISKSSVVSEKKKTSFNFGIMWPWPRNDLDLWYSSYFTHPFCWLYKQTLSSQVAIVSEKSVIFPFFSNKCLVTKFDLGLKRFLKGVYHIWSWWPSWSCDLDSTKKLSLFEQIMTGRSLKCYISNFIAIGPLVQEKTFKLFFNIYIHVYVKAAILVTRSNSCK